MMVKWLNIIIKSWKSHYIMIKNANKIIIKWKIDEKIIIDR